MDDTHLVKLRAILDERFDETDLRALCFTLRIDYADLGGFSKPDKVISLVEYLDRRRRISDLVNVGKEQRPDIDWPEPPKTTRESSPPRECRNGTASTTSRSKPRDAHSPSPGAINFCKRIAKRKYWEFLENVATQAVVAGGIAGMGYYREALPWPPDLGSREKNPSTDADLQATARILETVYSLLDPRTGASELDCRLRFLAEETKYWDWFQDNVKGKAPDTVQSAEEFFTGGQGAVLRILVDGIDGTVSFVRGFPLFCSAAAILVGDQSRVSAIYDPIHHVVYSARLEGSYEKPEEKVGARMWEIATGNRIDLRERTTKERKKRLKEEAIGIHLTRSNPQRLHEFLETRPGSKESMLERLTEASGGIYALNSGILAMAYVAAGTLGGFVNNVTNLWDVAAGEVLVRACGGKVTQFDETPIEYRSANQISVVAAKEHLHQEILDVLNGKE